jgi:hypothetical protein
MTGNHHQPPVSQPEPGQPPPNPDAGQADAALISRLQNELAMTRQDPSVYPSGWAAAFGGPTDITFGAATTSPVGGGYQVSPEGMQDWINQLQAILDKITQREDSIRMIEQSQVAAPDVASTMANGAYQGTGHALRRSNDAMKAHGVELMASFKTSLQTYQHAEQANRDVLHNLDVEQ